MHVVPVGRNGHRLRRQLAAGRLAGLLNHRAGGWRAGRMAIAVAWMAAGSWPLAGRHPWAGWRAVSDLAPLRVWGLLFVGIGVLNLLVLPCRQGWPQMLHIVAGCALLAVVVRAAAGLLADSIGVVGPALVAVLGAWQAVAVVVVRRLVR